MIIIVPLEELLSQNSTELSFFARHLIYELVQKKPTAPLTLIVLASSWQKPLPENVFQFLTIIAQRIRHTETANTGLVVDLEFQGISLTLADFNKLSAALPAFRLCNIDDNTARELMKNMPIELAAQLQKIRIRVQQTPLTKNQAATALPENAETITVDINARPIYKNEADHLIIANLRIDKFYEDVLRFLRDNISTEKHLIFSPMGLALLTTEQLTDFLDFLRTSFAKSITLDGAEGPEILKKAKTSPNLLSSFTALRDSKPLIFTQGDKYFRVDRITNENWVHKALSARDQFAYEILKRYKMQGKIVIPLSYVTAISNENDLAMAVQQVMRHVGAYCAEENKRGLVDANNQKLAIVIGNDDKLEQTPAQLVHVINSVAASVQNINRKTTLDLQNIFVSAAKLKETKRNIAQFNDLILNQNSLDDDILRHNSFSLIDNLCGLERLIIQNDSGQQVIPRQEILSYLSASALHYENESSVVFKNRDLSKDGNLLNVHAKIKNQPLVSLLQCRLHRIPEDRLEKLLDSFTQSKSQYFYFSAEEFNKIQAAGSAKIHASLDLLIQNKTVTLIDKTEAQTNACPKESQLNGLENYPSLKKQKKAQLLDIPALTAKVEETIAAFEKSKAYRFYQFSGIDIANKGKKVELLKNALATAKQAPATTADEFLNSGGEEKSLRAALSFSRYGLFAKTGNTKSLQAIEAKVAEFNI